jgi:hypothetical protein
MTYCCSPKYVVDHFKKESIVPCRYSPFGFIKFSLFFRFLTHASIVLVYSVWFGVLRYEINANKNAIKNTSELEYK